jgi:hypothetical protein
VRCACLDCGAHAHLVCVAKSIYITKLFYINTRHKKPTPQTHIIARENKTISILNEHDYSRALFHLRQGTQRALLFDSFSLSLFLSSALSFLSLENRENRIPFLGEEPQKLEFSFTRAARFLSFLLSFLLSFFPSFFLSLSLWIKSHRCSLTTTLVLSFRYYRYY